jgi:hypothetical protein
MRNRNMAVVSPPRNWPNRKDAGMGDQGPGIRDQGSGIRDQQSDSEILSDY